MSAHTLNCITTPPSIIPWASGLGTTHLDKRVDYTNIGTGIEDLVESRLSVDQLQLVKLLVILEHTGFDTSGRWCCWEWGSCGEHLDTLLTTSFLTRASLSLTISLSSAITWRSSGRLSLFLNFSSVPSNLWKIWVCCLPIGTGVNMYYNYNGGGKMQVTHSICRAEILSFSTSWALLKSASMMWVSLWWTTVSSPRSRSCLLERSCSWALHQKHLDLRHVPSTNNCRGPHSLSSHFFVPFSCCTCTCSYNHETIIEGTSDKKTK